MTWVQILMIFIFLCALMVLPIPFYYQHIQAVDMENYLPKVSKLLTNSQLEKEIKQADYTKETFDFDRTKVLKKNHNEILGIELSEKQIANYKIVVSVNPNDIYLKEKGAIYKLNYSTLRNMQAGSFKNQVNWLWYQNNKGAVAFSMLLIIGSVIVLTNIMLVFLAAIFVWLARKSPYITIDTYRESVGLMLNSIGISSIVSMIVGLVHFDISVMLILQMILCSLMLLLIYSKTHFSDEYLSKINY
ncbi:DUF1189 family protein [Liquorilactobacillus vini]|uniref:DUF1189 family protein n=1 Tax=Liquorilactobacillus vini TaxID=238015 RepID=UPI000553356C|nr:DUF1189 family protein [Liquorilactobacillus vini]